MSKRPDKKDFKDKKEYQRKKNRWFFEVITQHFDQLANVDIGAPQHAPAAPAEKPSAMVEGELLAQHVQTIRNRVTGRKRRSQDRWNRFAGTAAAGGRGR